MLPWIIGKNLYAAIAVVAVVAAVVVGYKIHEAKKIAAAVEATKARISADALAAVEKTAEAEREAIEITPLPRDKSAIVELCKRSASCRERSTLK